VDVIATGACTCLGYTASATAAAVRARISRLAEHPYAVDRRGAPITVAAVPTMADEPVARRLDRLASTALRDALAGLPSLAPYRVGLLLGLPDARPGFPPDAAHRLVEAATVAVGPDVALELGSVFTHGHAAGLAAIEAARDSLGTRYDVCLVLAADSYLSIDTLEWMEANEALFSPTCRWGYVPGEAAGVCVLGDPHALRELGWARQGEVLAGATALEPDATDPTKARSARALGDALARALTPLPPGAPVSIYCDLNGERSRADEYGFAALRVRRQLADPSAVCAPASMWGDVGAATGPLLVALAVEAHRRGYATADHSLVWCASASGDRAALLLNRGAGR